MNKEEIKVSILCLVYNHEAYLRECLDGFIKQKTNFRFEAIIHDDCSTDKSKQIIEEYAEKYPNIIIPIYENENQYSKGIKIITEILMPNMRGKYFALCEGDDYWIDEYKLQKQFDFMEEHKQYSLCTHNALLVDVNSNTVGKVEPTLNNRDIPCEEFIINGGGFIATNSIFAPSYLTKQLPEYFKIRSADYTWQIYLSSQGKTYCFSEYMSAYRINVPGSWTRRNMNNENKITEWLCKNNELLKAINKETNNKYQNAINERIIKNQISIYEMTGNYKMLKKEPYKAIYKSTRPLKSRIKCTLKGMFPKLYKKYLKIKRK